MNLSQLLPLLDGYEPLVNIVDALGRRKRRAPLVEGVPVAAKGFLLARIQTDLSRPLLLVTYSDEQANRLAEDLRRFLPEDSLPVRLLPSSLSLVLDDEESGRDISRAGQRVAALTGLANGELSHLVAPITALLQKVPPPATLKNRRLTVSVGDSVSLDVLSARLTAFGYVREDQVSLPGTFARRGDILDVFPADSTKPIRVDLFGDEVETIRPFDRETQRSEGKQPSIIIPAAHEVAYTRETMASASATLRKRLENSWPCCAKTGPTPTNWTACASRSRTT
jgi:transcription-repair coupling factor (superfamily II helicase)